MKNNTPKNSVANKTIVNGKNEVANKSALKDVKTKKTPAKSVEVKPTAEQLAKIAEQNALVLKTETESKAFLAQQMSSGSVVNVIENLRLQTDETLNDLLIGATSVERLTFILTGSIAYEIYNRALNNNEIVMNNGAGNGLRNVIRDIAQKLGFDVKTMEINVKIYEEFEIDFIDLLKNSPEKILPREYYATAVKTEYPAKTLKIFEENYLDPAKKFNVKDARTVAKLVNEGKSAPVINKQIEKAVATGVTLEELAYPVKSGSKSSATTETKVETLHLELTKNDEIISLLGEINEKYAGFENWFLKRAREEFSKKGDATPKADAKNGKKPTPSAKERALTNPRNKK